MIKEFIAVKNRRLLIYVLSVGLNDVSSFDASAVMSISMPMKPPVAQAEGCQSPVCNACQSEMIINAGATAVMQFAITTSRKKKLVAIEYLARARCFQRHCHCPIRQRIRCWMKAEADVGASVMQQALLVKQR